MTPCRQDIWHGANVNVNTILPTRWGTHKEHGKGREAAAAVIGYVLAATFPESSGTTALRARYNVSPIDVGDAKGSERWNLGLGDVHNLSGTC